ncbi:hypothetical protein FSPOR_10360 [Fusarium sporotrichioides]|uniref:Uncharacterized protein n=1 Tax=Fusarium sporotrichioides TaxID=5514 RepID=A0A395RM53_FUSSP|nr:hypothetical protein FSPOR_10360 [Fusarium sporotrichioides]
MDFLVNPEAYPVQGQQNGARADMIVRELVQNQYGPGYITGWTYTYFEGKGGNNAMNGVAIRQQMEDYLDQAIGNVQGRSCWAIGAKGHRM